MIFSAFSLIYNDFIKIHEYLNKIICIFDHHVDVRLLKINLIPGLVFQHKLLLRYECFCMYTISL